MTTRIRGNLKQILPILLIEEFDTSRQNKHVEVLKKRNWAGRAGYLVCFIVRWKGCRKRTKLVV